MAKKDKNKNKNKNEDGVLSRIISAIFVLLIIFVWLVIIAALIRFDVGGFGSGVLRPVLKDVPVINKVLPEPTEQELEKEAEEVTDNDEIATMSQAKDMIEQLQAENKKLSKSNKKLKESNADLTDEVNRLKVFEDNQTSFEKEKEEFYNQIVYGNNAPDTDTYKEWYESIDAEHAEAIYKQVLASEQSDSKIKSLAKTYENMKPAEAAKVFQSMKYDMDTIGLIMSNMKPDKRAKVMDEMDSDFAALVTRKLMPY